MAMKDKFNFVFKRTNALFELKLRIYLRCTGQLIKQRLEYYAVGRYTTFLRQLVYNYSFSSICVI